MPALTVEKQRFWSLLGRELRDEEVFKILHPLCLGFWGVLGGGAHGWY